MTRSPTPAASNRLAAITHALLICSAQTEPRWHHGEDMALHPRTLVDKVWDRHQIADVEGERLLYVDYLLLHEGARHAFDDLEATGRKVHRPNQVIACADHYVPTRSVPTSSTGAGASQGDQPPRAQTASDPAV